MEEMERLRNDFAIDTAVEDLARVAALLPRLQDKLKILEAALAQITTAGLEEAQAPAESFPYIPLDLADFFDCMFDLEAALAADPDYADPDLRHRRVDLVEAGCGPGRNLFLLGATDRFEFRRLEGFDHAPELIDQGRRVFGLGERIYGGDCNSFDYAPWDVVYFYRPFSDPDAQNDFEQYLVGKMRSGAYVIGCGHVGLDRDRRLLEKCGKGRIFKKLR